MDELELINLKVNFTPTREAVNAFLETWDEWKATMDNLAVSDAVPYHIDKDHLGQNRFTSMVYECASQAMSRLTAKKEELIWEAIEKRLGHRPTLQCVLPRLSNRLESSRTYITLDGEDIILFVDERFVPLASEESHSIGFKYAFLV